MADFIIKVSPETMLKQAESIKGNVKNIEKLFTSIEERVFGSRTYWEGSASNTHITRYNKIQENCRDIIRRLSEHPEDLLKMAGLYQETETQAKESAESLAGNILS